MITVQELKLLFGVRNVKAYGPCIVIPKSKFNIEWESQLRSQNIDIEFNVDLPGGDKCTVLNLKPEHLEDLEERDVYAPQPEPKRKQPVSPWQNPESRWRLEEDELLINLWNKGIKVDSIINVVAERFPKRTDKAVKNRLHRLRKAGKVASRTASKKRLQTAAPKPATSSTPRTLKNVLSDAAAGPEPAKRKVSQTSPKAISEDIPSSTVAPERQEDLPELVKLLREIRDLLKPKLFYFDYACPKCSYCGSVDEGRIWRFCPVCGRQLIIWNVEASA